MNRVGSCDTPEHLGAQCLKFGTVRFCCPEVPKLLRPGLCPISSPARMTPSSQPYPPPVHFPPAARAAPLKLSMLLTPCSAPHPPMAPHFSWGKSQSPQGPEALPDPALPPPQPLLPPTSPSPLLLPASLQHPWPPHCSLNTGFLSLSTTGILGQIIHSWLLGAVRCIVGYLTASLVSIH